jgi:hypothetical protein
MPPAGKKIFIILGNQPLIASLHLRQAVKLFRLQKSVVNGY